LNYRLSYLLTAVALSKDFKADFGLRITPGGMVSLTESLLKDFRENMQAILAIARSA